MVYLLVLQLFVFGCDLARTSVLLLPFLSFVLYRLDHIGTYLQQVNTCNVTITHIEADLQSIRVSTDRRYTRRRCYFMLVEYGGIYYGCTRGPPVRQCY